MPIALIPRLFTAFNSRDEEALRKLMSPEIVWDAPTAALAGRDGPYRGYEGLRNYLDDVDRLWEEMRATPIQVRMRGEEIFAVGRLYARGNELGIRDLPVAWTWLLRDRRFIAGTVHEDPRRTALEAGWLKPPERRQPA
jgi:ketosteroid isomerase-like protein